MVETGPAATLRRIRPVQSNAVRQSAIIGSCLRFSTRRSPALQAAAEAAGPGRPPLRPARLGHGHQRQLQRRHRAASRCGWRSRRVERSRASSTRTRSSRWTTRRRRSASAAARVSAEALLHVEIVRARGAGAVLHTHSIWSTLLSDRFGDARRLRDRGLRDAQGPRGRLARTSIASGCRSSRTIRTCRGSPRVVRGMLDAAPGRARLPAAPARAVHLGRDACRRPSATWRFSSSCWRRSADAVQLSRRHASWLIVTNSHRGEHGRRQDSADNVTLTDAQDVATFLRRTRHRVRALDAEPRRRRRCAGGRRSSTPTRTRSRR